MPKVVEKVPSATPFVKWAGGKRALLDEITKRMPCSYSNYWEPFIGGGALFYSLRPYLEPGTCHISDANHLLVQTYLAVKNNLEEVLVALRIHAQAHLAALKSDGGSVGEATKAYYYEIRGKQVSDNVLEASARFLYLNRTCYNGLWRVNSKGLFNVPIGSYVAPSIVQEDNLRACSAALQGVSIRCQSYTDIKPAAGDFVYFDPPYHPLKATSFTKYHDSEFSPKSQAELRDFAIKLHDQGVKVMLSNSHSPFIEELYAQAPFKYQTVMAPRFVGRDKASRASVAEALITTY